MINLSEERNVPSLFFGKIILSLNERRVKDGETDMYTLESLTRNSSAFGFGSTSAGYLCGPQSDAENVFVIPVFVL